MGGVMIQKKEPAAGEWWRHITGGGIVFIIGQDVNGDPVAHDDDGDAWNVHLQSYEHLPHCTGFDWQPSTAKTTRTIKLCSVVYWDRPEAPMSTILTEQELEQHRKAWRTMHVVSETTVEVPL
jgi:hypothetical protein